MIVIFLVILVFDMIIDEGSQEGLDMKRPNKLG